MGAQGSKKNVLGVSVDVTNYEAAVDSIIQAAHARKPFAGTVLPVGFPMLGNSLVAYQCGD